MKNITSLREMATLADAPVALGTAVNLLVLDAYQRASHDWQKYTKIDTVPNFNDVKRVIVDTGDDDLEKVLEGEYYPEMGITETTNTWRVVKWGRLLKVTYEMIVNDDNRKLRDLAAGVGRLAAIAESKLVTSQYSGLSVSTGYDGNPLSGTMDTTLMDKAMATYAQLTDSNGNALEIAPAYVVTPPAYRSFLESYFRPSTALDFNPYAGAAEVVENRYLTGNKIFIFPNPNDFPALELDYLKVPADPREDYSRGPRVLVDQASSAAAVLPGDVGTSGDGFRYDSISYKVRHVFGAGVVESNAILVVEFV